MALRSQVDRLDRKLNAAAVRYASGPVTTVAADFLHGGEPTFARVFDRRGVKLAGVERSVGEPWAAFRDRAKGVAAETTGAASLVIGGLPDAVYVGGENDLGHDVAEPPRGAIVLDTEALHPSQVEALELIRAHRRVVLVAGRRWGKSALLVALAVDTALCGRRVGVFAPTRTLMSPLLGEISHALRSVKGVTVNKIFGEIRLPNGAHADFWSVDHTGRAGRGRKYHLVLIDEAAHDEGYLTAAFPAAITPTLLDYAGSIVEASTPNGVDQTNHFWQCAHDENLGFVTFHAPTRANPFLPPEEIVALRLTMRAEVASQELDALFVDMAGTTIFPLSTLLIGGQPHPDDFECQMVGLAIDSNSGKGGEGRDGCAAVVFALSMPGFALGMIENARCILLDWDIRSLSQGGVVAWIAHVKRMAFDWTRRLKPLAGAPVAFVEPAGNGFSIIEAARAQAFNPREIDDKFVTLGKDGRALACDPHAIAGRLKIAKTALERRSQYRGENANHLTKQLCGFRAFDKEACRREDDLFDAAMYATLVSLGDGTENRWARLQARGVKGP